MMRLQFKVLDLHQNLQSPMGSCFCNNFLAELDSVLELKVRRNNYNFFLGSHLALVVSSSHTPMIRWTFTRRRRSAQNIVAAATTPA